MFKHLATATALSALMIASAGAQSTPPSSSTSPGAATPPAASSTTSPSTSTTSQSMSNTSAMGGAGALTSQKPDQWVASKFKGTDVLGPDNQKVGDVSDILFDQSGQIAAYIVSVGGFLGMGAKEVALAPSSFQVVSGEAAKPSTTGAGNSTTTSATTAYQSDEKKLKISMTKDQLKEAANFEYYKEPSRAPTTPGSTAPRPGTPGSGTR